MDPLGYHNSDESSSPPKLDKVALSAQVEALNLTVSRKLVVLNAAFNVLSRFASAFIYIILTPYLLSRLGVDVYGVIPLIAGVAAYGVLISVGLGTALNRYATYHLASKDIEQTSRYVSTALFSLLLLCFLMLVPVGMISYSFPRIFQVPEENHAAAKILMLICGLDVLLMTATSPLDVAYYARQKFYLRSLFHLISALFRAAVILLLFEFLGSSLVFVGFGAVALTVPVACSRIICFRILLRGVKISIKLWNRASLKDLFGFSFYVVISQISTMIFLSTDVILINLFIGSSEVAIYSLAAKWIVFLRGTTNSMASVLTPAVTIFDARQDSIGLKTIMLSGTRYIATWLCLPTILLVIYAVPLLQTWVGNEGQGAVTILWILASPTMFTMGTITTSVILTGLGKVNITAWVSLAAAIVNIGLSLFLMLSCKMGAMGVALATSMVLVLKDGFFIPLYTCRVCRISPQRYYGSFLRPILAILPSICVASGFVLFINLQGWGRLISTSIIVSLPFLLFVYMFVMIGDERRRLLQYLHKFCSLRWS